MAAKSVSALESEERELAAKLAAVRKAINDRQRGLSVAVGKAVLAEAEDNKRYRKSLLSVLDRRVSGKRNRALVGLDNGDEDGDHTITGD